MRKICVFCETLGNGGIESFLCKLLSQMDRQSLEIDLVAARTEGESIFVRELKQSGVRIVELSGSKSRWWSNLHAFDRLLKEKNYDLIHLNAFQGLQFWYLYLAKRAGVPVRIAHSHGSGLRKSPLRWAKWMLHSAGKRFFEGAATVRWACSQSAAEFLFPRSRQVRIIEDGISTERFRFHAGEREAVREKLGLTGKYVVCSVGRLQYDKNQAFLLEVLAELLPRRPESMLLLVGEGAARRELEQKARELGVVEQTIFYGTSDCVERLLWAADVFAFPSLSEGLGLAAVEAQTAGLPVVCSEHIPEEANLTEQFCRVPLTRGAAAWAEALLAARHGFREASADAVREAGYDMAAVAERVCRVYLGKETE